MAIQSLIKSVFPDRAPISIGESGVHVVQQILVRIFIQKLGESGLGGLGGVHVIEQSITREAGLVIDRGGSYKDGQDMKSLSVKKLP